MIPQPVRWAGRCLFWVGTVFYVVVFAFVVMRYEGRFSPDSVVYVDTARTICAGRGIASSLYPIDYALRTDCAPPGPMTMWAPLYPLLIAAVHGLGWPATAAALAVPLVFLPLLLLSAWFLTRRLYGRGAAMLCVALLVHWAPLSTVATHAWSETGALAFALAGWACALSGRTDRARLIGAAAAGLCCGLAFATRYALLPFVFIMLMACIDRHNFRTTLGRIVVLGFAFTLMAGPVMVRNFLLAGHPLGLHLPGAGQDWARIWTDVQRAHVQSAIPLDPVAWFVYQAGFTLLAISGAIRLVQRRLFSTLCDAVFRRKRVLLLLWAGVYLLCLGYSQRRFAIDPIDFRLIAPGAVALVILAAGVATTVWGRTSWIPGALAGILMVLALVPQTAAARRVLNARLAHAYDFGRMQMRSQGLNWVAQHVTDRDLLIIEDGYDLPLCVGPLNMLFFDGQTPAEVWQDPRALLAYLDRHRGRYDRVYLCLRHTGSRGIPFLDDLAAGRLDACPGVTLEARLDDADIFRLQVSSSPGAQ